MTLHEATGEPITVMFTIRHEQPSSLLVDHHCTCGEHHLLRMELDLATDVLVIDIVRDLLRALNFAHRADDLTDRLTFTEAVRRDIGQL